MIKVVCVTGVAGSGKTRFARRLARSKDYMYLDVNKIIGKNKEVISGYDKKLKTKIIDIDKLKEVLTRIIEKSKKKLVIDSHLSHYLDKKYVDKVFIIKCEVNELRKRLKKRGYNKKKIEENVEAEIMDVCFNEAKELEHDVKIVRN